MLFALIAANILLVMTDCVTARPADFNPSLVRYIALQPVQQFVPERSHPFEVVAEAPRASAPMEVSDDDQYDESVPRAVAPVPMEIGDFRPEVYKIITNEEDLSAAASEHDPMQAAATGHDHGGWLDMGAYSSGKGAFGWYADYPVGGGHGWKR